MLDGVDYDYEIVAPRTKVPTNGPYLESINNSRNGMIVIFLRFRTHKITTTFVLKFIHASITSTKTKNRATFQRLKLVTTWILQSVEKAWNHHVIYLS